MRIRQLIVAAILAVAGLFATAGVTYAQEAAATTALNVRAGPGTNYRVVGVLQRNQVVQVLECNTSNTWCRVQDRTLRGWASRNYLRPISGVPGRPDRPDRPDDNQPDIGFSVEGPNFSFSIGTGGRDEPRRGRVCFYEEYGYNGRSFCVRDGESARTMERFWDDRIRSARVDGDVSATVCTRTNFNGRCAVIDRSIRSLGALADEVSSFYVSDR